MVIDQGYINHIGLVLDASHSMSRLASTVVTVADGVIEHLARRSQEVNQETRVTLYSFDDTVKCLVYDKDVLRLPKLGGLYRTGGNTALVGATLKAISDLKQTATLYGDHAFLLYVLTDGQENASTVFDRAKLRPTLQQLPENWTVGVMVPDQSGVFEAKQWGFPATNIQVWNPSERGVGEMGEVIRRTTDTFLDNRARGVRGTRTLFQLDTSGVKTTELQRLSPHEYDIHSVWTSERIDEFVETVTMKPYRLGSAYYELVKRETVQASKHLAIWENATGHVYVGEKARTMLGLDSTTDVKVSPNHDNRYTIFVQSTSNNRKLMPGQKVLVRR